MINLHERMLPTSAGVEPATSWSPVGRRIQLSHRGRHFWVDRKKKKAPYLERWELPINKKKKTWTLYFCLEKKNFFSFPNKSKVFMYKSKAIKWIPTIISSCFSFTILPSCFTIYICRLNNGFIISISWKKKMNPKFTLKVTGYTWSNLLPFYKGRWLLQTEGSFLSTLVP